jgi:hypothetical protein
MGFLDFLKGIGHFIKSGIQKVAGFVGHLAPVVSKVAGLIPLPQAQGIAAAANAVGQVANAVAPDSNASAQVPTGTAPPPPDSQQQQVIGQAPVPTGTAPPAGPIM